MSAPASVPSSILEWLAHAKEHQEQRSRVEDAPATVSSSIDYRTIPHLSRAMWKEHAADPVSEREKHVAVPMEMLELALAEAKISGLTHVQVPIANGTSSDVWISVRLDLRAMGSCFNQLRKIGVFPSKWSLDFHLMMADTIKVLMNEYRGFYGFTQSDEMELAIDALTNPEGQHPFQGKHDKLISLSASLASSHLNRLVQRRAEKLNLQQVWFEVLPCELEDANKVGTIPLTPFAAMVQLKKQVTSGKGALFLGFLTQAVRASSLIVEDMGGSDSTENFTARASFVINNEFAATMSRDAFRQCVADNIAKAIGLSSSPADKKRVLVVDSGSAVLPLLTFDARMATWKDDREVQSLLLWRAWDSRINGLTSAVYDEEKQLATLDSTAKLEWLAKHNKLPLPDGQAYGSFFQRQMVDRETRNLRTGEWVCVKRKAIVSIAHGDVINHFLERRKAEDDAVDSI